MTSDVSNTTGTPTTAPTQPQADTAVGQAQATGQTQLPQDVGATPPPAAAPGAAAGAAPAIGVPADMSMSQVTLLVSQLQNKSQDQSLAVTQEGLQKMNEQQKHLDGTVASELKKMADYIAKAKKDSDHAELGLDRGHGKFKHMMGKVVENLSIAGIGLEIAADVENTKASYEKSDEEHTTASLTGLQKSMSHMQDRVKNIVGGLNETASNVEQMLQGNASAQEQILSGMQKKV
jgi:hypothetical protein